MKSMWRRYTVAFIAAPVGLACIVATVFLSKILAVCELVLLVVLCAAYVLQIQYRDMRLVDKVRDVSSRLNIKDGSDLERTPFSVVAFDSNGEVFWFNNSFALDFLPENKTQTKNIAEILAVKDVETVTTMTRAANIETKKQYSAYCSQFYDQNGSKEHILYLFDDTELKNIEKKYYDSRIAVISLRVDNTNEIFQSFKESQCGAIFARIEELINEWAVKYSSVCRKLSVSRYLIFTEEQKLSAMIADKFKLLEQVRNLAYADRKINATISIGIGKSDELTSADEDSKIALEMAQSRGGDQVAIKEGTEYTFFGGVSGGFDRSNKTKARQIASSLSQLIKSSENVIVMGHRFADLDSLGSAMGIVSIAKAFKKPVNIVINKETSLALPLLKKLEENGKDDVLVPPEKAMYMVSENTVLVVVDTHRTDFTECPELLKKTNKVVIIDHHRKCVDSIENPVISFLSPVASSASEMITELCQYVQSQPIIDSLTAVSLLSGITLDTRNFVLRTGVRTFEAAAYLRARGADTVEVKKLFSNDAEINKCRNKIVDDSFNYKDCAISIADIDNSNVRLITSQAADELLNLDGVKASFVAFDVNNTVCISARSFGEMNVQVIMEKFGGGGHATMAAAQISNSKKEDVLKELELEIDRYYENI